MNIKRRFIWILVSVAAFCIAYLVSASFGAVLKAGIGRDGVMHSLDEPVYMWTVLAWPIAAFVIGLALGRAFGVRLTRFAGLAGIVLTVLALLYGVGFIAACAFGMKGLHGLLGYYGGSETWPSTRVAMYACPFIALLGIIASACMRTKSEKGVTH